MHVTAVVLITELAQNFWFTTSFVIVAFIIDKRIAGIHITLLASIINLSQFSHKFYIFAIVDRFGIFVPQILISVVAFGTVISYKERIFMLDDVPREKWQVSDEIILANSPGNK